MGSVGTGIRDVWTGRTFREWVNRGKDPLKSPDAPTAPGLPAPVEDIDVAGQRQYTKQRLKQRQGRASTILTNKLGNANSGGRGVLG